MINGNMSRKGTETYHAAESRKKNPETESKEPPSAQVLCEAIMETKKKGLWWSGRAWAVVYSIYHSMGYDNGYSQFAREANSWKLNTGYECTYDAVQKLFSSGKLAGDPDNWEANGAPSEAVSLGKALKAILKEIVRRAAS